MEARRQVPFENFSIQKQRRLSRNRTAGRAYIYITYIYARVYTYIHTSGREQNPIALKFVGTLNLLVKFGTILFSAEIFSRLRFFFFFCSQSAIEPYIHGAQTCFVVDVYFCCSYGFFFALAHARREVYEFYFTYRGMSHSFGATVEFFFLSVSSLSFFLGE